MKFFGNAKSEKKILFVCVENAGRSQMAEGFFKKYAPKGWAPISAGTRPTSDINSLAVQVMEEVGIDITKQRPKELSEELIRAASLKVSMGCIDRVECPAVFLGNHQDWGIEDPKDKPIEMVREIRDRIENQVKTLCKSLK